MNKAKFFSRIIIILMTTSILLSLLIFPTNNYPNEIQIDLGNNNDENFQEENLKTSNKDLNYTSVFQNTSFIRRDFESLYFEVNVSQFEYANKTSIEIEFPNNTLQSFEMNYTIGTTMNFTYEYKPKGDAPLGFHRVRFIVKNISLEQLNTGNLYTNFTVSSTSWVIFNNSEYFRGECLRANILFLDISTNYNWKAVVVNTTIESQQNIIEEFFQDPEQITFIIDEEFDQLDYNYYLAINITEDDWNTWNVDYWAFYIKNSVPIIYENTIQFNPTSVFREERCDVQVSVNDSESNPSNVDVNIRLIDPNRNDAYTQTLLHSGNGLYKGNFTISGSRPKGIYEVEFEAIDGDGGNCTVFKKITIKNNLPEIDGYEINDIDTDEPISVNYGDDLKFKFDVDDIEGVAYVTIELILEDATDEDEEEFEITREYEDDLEIVIRTEDLAAGTWTVYVSVTDTDGETTELGDNFDNGPQQITVIPDLLSTYLAWITLIVGSILGIIAGLGIGFYLKKSKYPEYKSEEEKVIQQKKPKTVKKSITPTKPKAIEKETEKEPEKKESIEPVTKRKIKRKL